MTLLLPIILGTVRTDNRSSWVARFIQTRFDQRRDLETQVISADDAGAENLRLRLWEHEDAPEPLAHVGAILRQADGFIVVCPEYNHGYPGAIKNLFDHYYEEWSRKPFALVGTGGISGGIRALEQLRPVINGLGAIPIPRSMPVPSVSKAFSPEGPAADADRWAKRTDSLLDELEWYARALKAARGP